MSRSYRKNPWVTDGQNSKGSHRKLAKRTANKRVRASRDLPDGRSFAKVSNPYDICDFKFFVPEPKTGTDAEVADWKSRVRSK